MLGFFKCRTKKSNSGGSLVPRVFQMPIPKGARGPFWGVEMMVGVPLIKNVIIVTVLFLYQLAYAGDIMRLIHILELSYKGKIALQAFFSVRPFQYFGRHVAFIYFA